MSMVLSSRSRRFRELYVHELGFVWTVLRRLGVEESQVEDAAHDVFVVVHRQLDGFEGRSSPRTWLYAIARRIAWRHRRTQRRRSRRHAALAAEHPRYAEPEVDEVLRQQEATMLLHAFLETLDEPKREAFVLGELERLPRASLGRALGASPGTAYSRLRAARAEFAAAFGPEGRRAAVVRRLAQATEEPPRPTRDRLWLALPGSWFGRLVTAKGLVGTVATASVLVVIAVGSSSGPERTRASATPPSPVAAPREPAERAVPTASPHAPIATETPPVVAPVAPGVPPSRSSSLERSGPVPRARVGTLDPPATASSRELQPLDTLAEEAELISAARAFMRAGRWEQASAQLRRHAERFPDGHLAQERDVSTIAVACGRGDRDEAMARARALLRSPVSASMRALLRPTCVANLLESSDVLITQVRDGDQGE